MEKLLGKTKMLSSRPAERRFARLGLPELLRRRRVVRRPPALVRQWSAPTARMEWVVGVHRPRARMPFPHHLDHAVAGEMCAEKFGHARSIDMLDTGSKRIARSKRRETRRGGRSAPELVDP